MLAYGFVGGDDGAMSNVFASKTRRYGTESMTFSSLMNGTYGVSDPVNRFYHLSGATNTLNIGTISSGIVYCDGNLTISGSGTFRGSVICAGNVTVSPGVRIVYDEDVIRSVMGFSDGETIIETGDGSRIARRFFGTMTTGGRLGL
jgi:hypothetical protein